KQWGLLVVTHDPHELSGLADRVYRLETGRLLAAQPDLAL
ncbi:MAG: ABC transporter ATP-binding protein, partial [Gemmatimonadaceae bacterium]|nr:ABC transporter ATP-binding protein [Gloeobacterales cyanobacterium ES-bin-141]